MKAASATSEIWKLEMKIIRRRANHVLTSPPTGYPCPAAGGTTTEPKGGHGAYHDVRSGGIRDERICQCGSYHNSAAFALQSQRHFSGLCIHASV